MLLFGYTPSGHVPALRTEAAAQSSFCQTFVALLIHHEGSRFVEITPRFMKRTHALVVETHLDSKPGNAGEEHSLSLPDEAAVLCHKDSKYTPSTKCYVSHVFCHRLTEKFEGGAKGRVVESNGRRLCAGGPYSEFTFGGGRCIFAPRNEP